MFIDAIVVKVRDGQVANRPVYAAIEVTLAGEKDVLGLWAGTGGEGAKFWMSVLTDLRNRGIKDVFFVVCDGLKGRPWIIGVSRNRQTAMPENAAAEPTATARPPRRSSKRLPETPVSLPGITLSDEGGQGERARSRRSVRLTAG